MNRHVYWAGPLAALVLALLFFGIVWNLSAKVPHGFYDPYVKVIGASGGHGSGTHIGSGYILTAGHVAEGKEMSIQTNIGSALKADVLWVNTDLDVALLRLQKPSKLPTANLSCAPNFVGQRVQSFGNPQWLERVYARGEVVGTARHVGDTIVVPLDLTAAPGMSGGPLIDDAGNVVGIMVAKMATGEAFAFGVPGRVVCDLLARA